MKTQHEAYQLDHNASCYPAACRLADDLLARINMEVAGPEVNTMALQMVVAVVLSARDNQYGCGTPDEVLQRFGAANGALFAQVRVATLDRERFQGMAP